MGTFVELPFWLRFLLLTAAWHFSCFLFTFSTFFFATPYQVGDQLESLMERLKDMATAGVSAVAAARAAKASVKKRYGGGSSGYEEDKQGDGDDDDDHDLANNVYDELARFQVIVGVFCCFCWIERDEERIVCGLSIFDSLSGALHDRRNLNRC